MLDNYARWKSRNVQWRTVDSQRCSLLVVWDVREFASPCSCAEVLRSDLTFDRLNSPLLLVSLVGNLRLQEMMGVMAKERNGRVCAMDHRYCVDNGAMIAQAGVLQFQYGELTPLEEATCTQRHDVILPFVWDL